MKDKGIGKRWITWLYAAVLLMAAVIGAVYCAKLNSDADAANTAEYYAVEENINPVDGGDIIDLGDISTDVPLGSVDGE